MSHLPSNMSHTSLATMSTSAAAKSSNAVQDDDVVIVSMARTPFGSFQGSLSSLTAIELGTHVIKHAVSRSSFEPAQIDEVIMGNVVSSNLGQAPARQASMHASLPPETIAVTVNKVCASGAKALMMGYSDIKLGLADVVVCGGMESMSNSPHYINLRKENVNKLGDIRLTDAVQKDGLTDPFSGNSMGNIAEMTAKKYNLSREALDSYSVKSFRQAVKAQKEGRFDAEMAPVELPNGTIVSVDETVRYYCFPA